MTTQTAGVAVSVPAKYVVLDVETSGVSPRRDVVLQVGCVAVSDGMEVGRLQTTVLNWFEFLDQDSARELENAVQQLTLRFAANRDWTLTVDRLRAGDSVEHGLRRVVEFLKPYADEGFSLAGFNTIRFDIPFLDAALRRGLMQQFDWPVSQTYDVGEVTRSLASSAGIECKRLREFLAVRYPWFADHERAHVAVDADTDAQLCSRLLEYWRSAGF